MPPRLYTNFSSTIVATQQARNAGDTPPMSASSSASGAPPLSALSLSSASASSLISRTSSRAAWDVPYTLLSTTAAEDLIVDAAHPYTGVLDLENARTADGLSFQPCRAARCQDRYVVEQFVVRSPGKEITKEEPLWTLTGVFDGHLGESTVDHVAHHLPVIVREVLERDRTQTRSTKVEPSHIAELLQRAFAEFDAAIAGDVLSLFPGGLAGLQTLSDEQIKRVINDYDNGLENYRKVQRNMHGTTALIALVDPGQEHLWIATLGDCQAVLATRDQAGRWQTELLTDSHNGGNPREVERVRRTHPGEPDCVQNGRILGFIAPFRCFGDQAFKQPPSFTRRILFNLDTPNGDSNGLRSAWQQLSDRNRTPPYISTEADIIYRRILPGGKPGSPRQFLVLCTDGLPELYDELGLNDGQKAELYVDAVVNGPGTRAGDSFRLEDNLALRLLKSALGGEDAEALSQMVAVQSDEPWIDDVTVIVQTL